MIISGDPNLPYSLPAELLTPEKLEAAELEQRRLAQVVNSPYSGKSPQDIQRFNASITIKEVQEMGLSIAEMSPPMREQYAEALAEIGNYEWAAQVTAEPERQEIYQAIWDAIISDDGDKCECVSADFNGVRKSHLFAEGDVWSHKHGKLMPIIRCNQCGHRNVRSLPASIAKERDARKRARSYVAGKSHEDAKQILSQLK